MLEKINNKITSKEVFDQAKKKRLKGNGFDKIEKRFGSSDPKKSNVQNLPQEQLKSLNELYRQKKLLQVFKETEKLTKLSNKI